MKKAMLFVLCLIATTLAFAQKDLNSSQLKLRTEIFNFLKEEGFAPEIDKDGDIKFKRQGNYHYVIIAENNESPMYVEMERYVAVPEKYSEVTARVAAHNLSRRYKAVKCYFTGNDKVITFSAQMFVRSSEPFKEVFYKLCTVMDDMKEEMNERLEEATSVSSSNTTSIPLLDLMAEGMKEAYGGVPATVSVGKFNIEINDIVTDEKSMSIIMVFRMPKTKTEISEDEKSQALAFCKSGTKAATDELRNNPDLKGLGLDDTSVVYRLEDKYGTYIAGVKK